MPSILAIDTSSEACSVALDQDGRVAEKYAVMPRMHARMLLSMIQELLGDAQLALSQLDAVAFTRGPGSFTGLRISASAIQGLAFGVDIPVIPVSTLATLAQGGYRQTGCNNIMPIMDARMKEFYWGHFAIIDGLAKLQGAEELSPANELKPPVLTVDQTVVGIGHGWHQVDSFPDGLVSSIPDIILDFYPQAKDALVLAIDYFNRGEMMRPEEAIPVYLRGKSAWKKQNHG